ncbi:hypothetical protein D6779_03145 [Candidatus Parcubacteria bacterium]|nr:MAG: hypothetical protein D6779_03145 [Candidatus Parcubacteria bacterium]
MANQSLVSYIKESLAKGFSEDEIRAAVKKAGWQDADIAEAFTEAKVAAGAGGTAPQAAAGSTPQKRVDFTGRAAYESPKGKATFVKEFHGDPMRRDVAGGVARPQMSPQTPASAKPAASPAAKPSVAQVPTSASSKTAATSPQRPATPTPGGPSALDSVLRGQGKGPSVAPAGGVRPIAASGGMAAAVQRKKSSRMTGIIAAVLALLLVGGGGAAAAYFFLVAPAKKESATTKKPTANPDLAPVVRKAIVDLVQAKSYRYHSKITSDATILLAGVGVAGLQNDRRFLLGNMLAFLPSSSPKPPTTERKPSSVTREKRGGQSDTQVPLEETSPPKPPPQTYKLQATIESNGVMNAKDAQRKASEGVWDGSVVVSGGSITNQMSTSFSYKMIGDTLYFSLGDATGLLPAGIAPEAAQQVLGKVRGKWVKIDARKDNLARYGMYGLPPLSGAEFGPYLKEHGEELRTKLAALYKDIQLAVTDLGDTSLEGTAVAHYKVAISPQEQKKLIMGAIKILDEANANSMGLSPEMKAETERALGGLPPFVFEIWIGKEDAMPHRIAAAIDIGKVIRGIEEAMSDGGESTDALTVNGDVTVTLSFADFGKDLEITPPAESMTLDELTQTLAPLFGTSVLPSVTTREKGSLPAPQEQQPKRQLPSINRDALIWTGKKVSAAGEVIENMSTCEQDSAWCYFYLQDTSTGAIDIVIYDIGGGYCKNKAAAEVGRSLSAADSRKGAAFVNVTNAAEGKMGATRALSLCVSGKIIPGR